MSQRFYTERPISGDIALLTGPEAHHLLHVLRAEPGQEVILFDGTGQEFDAFVAECSRREVRLRIEASRVVSREPRLAIALGVALPKGERQRWLVEKCVELGVASLVPIITERGVAQPTQSTLKRLQRTVVEASKQCGRTILMKIAEPVEFREFLARTCEPVEPVEENPLRVCAHPEGKPLPPCPTSDRPVSLAVGPEGGFTDEEILLARDTGWTIAGLGPRILRVETAAVALAAVYTLGE